MAQATAKSLARLNKDNLLDLCAQWATSAKCTPYLASNRNALETEEEDYLHEPAETRDQLRTLYEDIRLNKSDLSEGLGKREIIDRIIDGDWRRGLSLHQLASIDFKYLEQNASALRWTALKLVPLRHEIPASKSKHLAKKRKISSAEAEVEPRSYPEMSVAEFVTNLRSQISPLVKSSIHVQTIMNPQLITIIRIHVTGSTPFRPHSSNIGWDHKSTKCTPTVVYVAIQDSCPFVHISVSGSQQSSVAGKSGSIAKDAQRAKLDSAATKRIIIEAIPKAFSRPQQRWSLSATKLTARNLNSILLLRGNGRQGSTGGAWSELHENTIDETATEREKIFPKPGPIAHLQRPLVSVPRRRTCASRHEAMVEKRFGTVQGITHAPIDRVQVRIGQLLQSSSTKRTKRKRQKGVEALVEDSPVTMTMAGSDVFAGLKQLALLHPELIDLTRLPAALTGQRGMSALVI